MLPWVVTGGEPMTILPIRRRELIAVLGTNAADYERAIPHAETVSFAGLGHLPQEEAPASTVGEVRAFLTR